MAFHCSRGTASMPSAMDSESSTRSAESSAKTAPVADPSLLYRCSRRVCEASHQRRREALENRRSAVLSGAFQLRLGADRPGDHGHLTLAAGGFGGLQRGVVRAEIGDADLAGALGLVGHAIGADLGDRL